LSRVSSYAASVNRMLRG